MGVGSVTNRGAELEMKLAEILLDFEIRSHTLSARMNDNNLVLVWH
jgi:hypothetical protein